MTESRQILEDLLVSCLELLENEGADAVEALIGEHAEHESALRRYLGFLGGLQVEKAPDSPATEAFPDTLGGFRLGATIGRGAMGEVRLAEQISLGRRCALKLVRLDILPESARERFRREAKALARIEHPHVVRVISSGEDDSIGFLAMELVEGRGLDEILATDEERVLSDFVRHARDIARALDAVHKAGLVHRDVKPSNIRITPEGEAVLIDFGLVRDLAGSTSGLSASGAFVGTPYYAAPEQLTGEPSEIGPTTDVYGLGVCLYECVTGRRPFDGRTPEQVFRQILTSEPEPPQSLAPAISGALARVILKAIEKDPARRYARAAPFGDDLDAVLELRPVSVRPDTFGRRFLKWSRRHRAAAGIMTLAFLAAIIVITTIAVGDSREADRRQREAALAVDDAMEQLELFRSSQGNLEQLIGRRAELVHLMPYRHLVETERRELDDIERRLEGSEGRHEQLFFAMLERLRRAEQLDPDVAGVSKARARIYLEKWRLARAAREPSLAAFYRDRVLEADPDGRYEAVVRGGTRLRITTEPADAEVHLFRLYPQVELRTDGEFRLVPLPHGVDLGTDGVKAIDPPPGSYCLRIQRPAGDLPADSLITKIDGRPAWSPGDNSWRTLARGGAKAHVIIDGLPRELTLPPGLVLRPTAMPMPVGAASRLVDPNRGRDCEAGRWLVLVRKPGYLSRRSVIPISLDSPTEIHRYLELDRLDDVPAGLIRLQGSTARNGQTRRWMMDHEVTCAEYLEFLNSDETLASIAAASQPVRFPRTEANAANGGYWTRGTDGLFRLGENWKPDMPVIGVSHDDAMAYASWATARAQKAGYAIRFDLPWQFDFICFATGQDFVWGDRFRPTWTNSCHSRPRPAVEPVLSYPIDESAGGIFDTAGSAQEWTCEWFAREQNERMLYGGSWAHARPERFRLDFVSGAAPNHAADTFGFRLVAVPID